MIGSDHKEYQSDTAFDLHAIPAESVESMWNAADGHAIRRIDWPGASGPGVSGAGVSGAGVSGAGVSGAGKDRSEVDGAGASGALKGSILFLPGRGDNYEKYLEPLHYWHKNGWRVTASDWRGQAGSGRLGNDAVTGHVEDFSIWIDDLAELWSKWKAETAGPHILMAHSMGGHLALRAVAEGRVDPDAVVLSAPMLGFVGQVLPLAVMHTIARGMTAAGDPARPAWKWSEKPGVVPADRASLLTHDKDRYAAELWWREERPELVMGPGSWGWVERSYASMRVLFAPGMLENVQTPVLMIATTADRLVGFGAIETAAKRLPSASLVRFGKESAHEILREADAVRNRALGEIDAFLDGVLSAR